MLTLLGGFLLGKVWKFEFGMLPGFCSSLTDFKTVRQRHSRRKSSCICKFKYYVQQWIYIDKQCHGITFDKDKDKVKVKDKDKDKDRVTERPNMCYIFENDMTQGCQI